MKQIRAIVHGIVQGVGFRYRTSQVAQQLGGQRFCAQPARWHC
ncbi:MAG: acylphosphatase [Nodosilinea sp.]